MCNFAKGGAMRLAIVRAIAVAKGDSEMAQGGGEDSRPRTVSYENSRRYLVVVSFYAI